MSAEPTVQGAALSAGPTAQGAAIPAPHPVGTVLEPWDLERGSHLDVLVFHDGFVSVTDEASCSHFAPNCATFSRARERPIPGVVNPPRPLRTEQFPRGLPGVKSRDAQRVENDTLTAELSAMRALQLHRAGKGFSLEHPARSLAFFLPSWLELISEPGVMVTRGHACMFDPCCRRKLQALVHSSRGRT